MYAKYVVEGTLPDTQETEDTIFQLLTTGLSGYLQPGASKKRDSSSDLLKGRRSW
mgnify:CR=1 FL=1